MVYGILACGRAQVLNCTLVYIPMSHNHHFKHLDHFVGEEFHALQIHLHANFFQGRHENGIVGLRGCLRVRLVSNYVLLIVFLEKIS